MANQTDAPRSPTTLPRCLGEAAVAFALALAAYACLGQGCYYGHDGWGFVRALAQPLPELQMHPLYMPIAKAWRALAAPLGLSDFVALRLLSAAGTALGVALAYAAARALELDPARAALVAALVATCPAVAFFATVVEIHGAFFAFAGLAFLLAAVLARRPGPIVALACGLSMALARSVHASGALLPFLLLPMTAVLAEATAWRRRAAMLGLAALAFALGVLALQWLLPLLGAAKDGADARAAATALSLWHVGLDSVGRSVLREWIVPYAPLSGIVVLLGLAPAERRFVLVLLLALVPYVFVDLLVKAHIDERGAYLLPWALPAALAVGRAWPRAWLLALLVIAALLAVWRIERHEASRGVDHGYADLARQAAAGQPSWFLVWDEGEVDSLLLAGTPQTEPVFLPNLTLLAPAEQAASLAVYRVLLSQRQTFLSAAAERALADPARRGSGGAVLEFLRREFRLEPLAAGAWPGQRLVARM